MISKACKYGIRAAVYVASRAGKGARLNVKDIAKEVDAPEAFTAKILQTLNKHRIITSLKGPYGGFYIEDYQLEQPVINIVSAIDGMAVFWECGLGLKKCSEAHPCPMHDKFKVAREAMRDVFQNTTIRQLAQELNEGTSFIKNPIYGLGPGKEKSEQQSGRVGEL
ncbi:RrF2 family transcriptional regulator [Pontibacter russatus]|uniref:RrF2 family transcriptional regulator n=1 Tax=Pontibacter russatus TaxID=2694929 RepID=UPI00137B4084|nr:Rrf2 family transcriptional regulator [Pontibacter russatus]